VIQITDILTSPTAAFKYELLYVPFILPFIFAAAATLIVHRRDLPPGRHTWRGPFREAWARMVGESSAAGRERAAAAGGSGAPPTAPTRPSLGCASSTPDHHRRALTPLRRRAGTVAAMAGALALAEAMRAGGAASPASILGYHLSAWMGKGYIAIAGLLGGLSTFVGGSVMAGNLTFGDIQRVRRPARGGESQAAGSGRRRSRRQARGRL
jgi:hypothetical protein